MIKQKFHIIAVLLFLVWNFSFSQGYTNYTTKDGLPSNLVYRITQDQKGFIWLITDKGISKFDGYTFKNFTIKDGLPTNDIWNIRITPDQKVWYFSESDALGYIQNDSVHSYKTSGGKVIMPRRINRSGNSIWLNESKYRHHFKDSIWQETTMDISNYRLYKSNLNLNLDENFKLEIRNKSNSVVLKSIGAIRNQTMNYQFNDSLLVIRNNKFYEIININTFENKYIEYENHKNPLDILNVRFHSVNDEIQITGNNNLIILDQNLNWSEHYNIPTSLKSHFNFKDKDGWIWVATFTDGIYKLPKNYSKIERFFSGKRISAINNIDGIMYVGVLGEGVYKIEDNAPTLHLPYASYIYEIVKIDNRIYFVLEHDIYIEDEKDLKHLRRKDNLNLGKHFVSYKNNLMSEGFLAIYSNSEDVFSKSKLYEDRNYSGIFIKNDTLFSTDNKKLVYFNDVSQRFENYKTIKFKSRYLSNKTYKNSTYIGVEGKGLHQFKNGVISQLITGDNTSISKIVIENDISIWCVADDVLTNYKIVEDDKYVKRNYPEINGLLVDNLKDVFIKDGLLHLGTEEGLMVLPIRDIVETSNLSMYLTFVQINGKEVSSDELEFTYDKNLNLNVGFSAINYDNASQTHFEYLLNPIQDTWIKTSAGEVNLNNLEPGDYNLKMKVFDDENEKIINLPIIVKPLWWQTLWFKLLAVLIGIVGVALVSRYIAKRSEFKKNKKIFEDKRLSELQLKALRSQMNPHFVFNSLSAIQYFINSNDIESSERYLVKFSKLIRQFFELSKENDIAINDEITLLQNYLDIEKLRFREKLSFQFNIADDLNIETTRIPTMLLQPIVENAINHGIFNKEENGLVVLNFSQYKENIKIEIIDDGVGFARSTKASEDKIKSSQVLVDRLYFLNQSKKWNIEYSEKEAFSNRIDKGNTSTFIIENLQ